MKSTRVISASLRSLWHSFWCMHQSETIWVNKRIAKISCATCGKVFAVSDDDVDKVCIESMNKVINKFKGRRKK